MGIGPGDASPPCLACGTCCFSGLASYVRVTGDDHARLGDDAERVVVFVENRAYMRMTGGHCAALDVGPGDVGAGSGQARDGQARDGQAGTFRCTVYDNRPQICRDLERGSPQCRGEIAAKGDRPGLALVALRARARDF